MKKSTSAQLLVMVLLLAGNVLAQNTVVKFAVGEWDPYTGETMPGNGMAVEIVSAACAAVGLKTEYHYFHWKRAENNVLTGNHAATFPYKELPERMTDFVFSNTLFASHFAILMHKNNYKTERFKFSTVEDFAHHTVGIVSGTDAIKNPLQRAGVKVEDVATALQNIKKLEAGRIDFYIDDKAVIYQTLKNYPEEKSANFIFAEQDFGETNDFKIMISRKYPNSSTLLTQINTGLDIIKQSGEYQRILGKYGL